MNINQSPNTHDFKEKMEESHKQDTKIQEFLKNYFINCESVTISRKLSEERKGIDFSVHLKTGKRIKIDLKHREKGASKYWQNGPEIALEIWSIKPNSYYYYTNEEPERQQIGWSLDDSKETDFILYTFDDIEEKYMISFELLKNALKKNGKSWIKNYKYVEQTTHSGMNTWKSSVLFLPVKVLLSAI